jgi:hypothetical protein
MLGCNCDAGLANTGRPGCVPLQSVTSKLIMVPLMANDGTLNGIDLTTALPTWSSLINQLDASKRWFPLPAFENVEMPKADSQFEEANSGRMAFLRQGKRSFAGELWGDDSTPTMLGKLNAGRCVQFGVYVVDVNGALIGSKVGGYLYPIPVDEQSFDPKWMVATDSTVQKIMVGFDFDRLFDDSTMYMITSSEAGINFNSLTGLIDINVTNDVVTATSITFDAVLDYGTALNPIKAQGLVSGDFTLTNVTTSSTVSVTAVENTPGNYTLTYVAQTTADVASLVIAKPGYLGTFTYTFA